jgi:hypothetical protein
MDSSDGLKGVVPKDRTPRSCIERGEMTVLRLMSRKMQDHDSEAQTSSEIVGDCAGSIVPSE